VNPRPPLNHKNPFADGYGLRSNFPPCIDMNNPDVPRYTYGRMRWYDAEMGRYSSWQPLVAHDPIRADESALYMDRPCVIQLKRGGLLRYFPKVMSEDRRVRLAQKCRSFQGYRQYKFGPGGLANEPRVHVLLASNAQPVDTASADDRSYASPGYQYHGIRMQAEPLESQRRIFVFIVGACFGI